MLSILLKQLYSIAESLAHMIYAFNEDAAAVVDWVVENGLKLNPEKPVAMLFGRLQYISLIDPSSLPAAMVNGVTIMFVKHMQNLGVFFAPSLNREYHVNRLISKVHSTLYSLRVYKKSLTRKLKASLVESLILFYFDYTCAVYHGMTQ